MFPQLNRGKATFKQHSSYLALPILLLTLVASPVPSASAHKVKIGPDVGATLHIEPNDNPRAGERAKTWFALTLKGGKVIPLQDCNCQLAIYAQPHTAGEPALLKPPLKPVVAERYQGTPGTEITFPRPGIYQLQLTGKPASGANFQPFKFDFEVTVAAGSSVREEPKNVENVNSNEIQNSPQPFPFWVLSIPLLGLAGILFVVQRGRKRDSDN
ncbi:MAG: hypothetical protein KME23_26305 [Goleter apudmare HA4340-LM2]|jgi:hypothetical protein|nr:hypothetical protein [Goleter apudmare HA4340-LM2]